MTESYNVYGKKSYAYALGRISGTPHKVLNEEMFGRLREADFQTAEKLLADYGYPAVTKAQTVYDVIEREQKDVSAFVREIAPDEEQTQLLFFEEDALNLKYLLKSALLEKDPALEALAEGGFEKELLRVCVKAADYSMLGESLEAALTGIEKETDPCRISCRVDNALFAHALQTAIAKNWRALVQLLTVYGTGKNRLTALRLRKLQKNAEDYRFAFLPVGEIPKEETAEAEILADTQNELEKTLTELGYDDGFGAIAQYYFRKKAEAAALRLLFAQKRVEMSEVAV